MLTLERDREYHRAQAMSAALDAAHAGTEAELHGLSQVLEDLRRARELLAHESDDALPESGSAGSEVVYGAPRWATLAMDMRGSIRQTTAKSPWHAYDVYDRARWSTLSSSAKLNRRVSRSSSVSR